jgi:GT2 family glycosyltransferase
MRSGDKLLDVVIVNYNSGRQLFECLESVMASPGDERCVAQIVVVDNASADGSMDGVEALGRKVRALRSKTNLGFAAACNLGAARGESPFILFLNPDTRIFPDALAAPLEFMSSPEAEGVGICGIQLVNETGQPRRGCGRIPSARNFLYPALGLTTLSPRLFPGVELAEFDHASDRDVDHVMGAFYLVRRELFDALNGFDERFFVYLEDLDFSQRAREAGWRTRFLAGARAFHLGGGASRNVKAARLFYSLRSRIIFSFKHLALGKAIAVLLASAVVELPLRLVRALGRGARHEGKDTLIGYARLYRDLPSILKVAFSCRSAY